MSLTTQSLDHPTAPWRREHGPLLHLGWLEHGNLTEPVPDWFAEFYIGTRDVVVNDPLHEECGMTSMEENWVIYQCARLARPSDCLEVGIMRGATSLTIGRALQDHAPDCHQVALDIDETSVDSVRQRMARNGMRHDFRAIAASSTEWIPKQDGPWQYAFIDGDHFYDTVVSDLVEIYNRLAVGGFITMHDVGSVQWGCHQHPGLVFFKALDRAAGEGAALGWLDSTERNQDMRTYASRGAGARIVQVAASVAEGWGGIGIIQKVSDEVRLTRGMFADARPFIPPPSPHQPQPHPSLIRRAARKVKRMIQA